MLTAALRAATPARVNFGNAPNNDTSRPAFDFCVFVRDRVIGMAERFTLCIVAKLRALTSTAQRLIPIKTGLTILCNRNSAASPPDGALTLVDRIVGWMQAARTYLPLPVAPDQPSRSQSASPDETN